MLNAIAYTRATFCQFCVVHEIYNHAIMTDLNSTHKTISHGRRRLCYDNHNQITDRFKLYSAVNNHRRYYIKIVTHCYSHSLLSVDLIYTVNPA